MKVKFLVTVTSPAWQAGQKGEVKNVSDRAAQILLKGRYAIEHKAPKKVAAKKKAKKKTKKK